MGRNYKRIVAWERSHSLTLMAYRYTKRFPSDERFGLISQLRRAAYGVPSNIAEGSGRDTHRDYLRFLFISLGSLKETGYFLLLARDLGYLNETDFAQATDAVNSPLLRPERPYQSGPEGNRFLRPNLGDPSKRNVPMARPFRDRKNLISDL